MERKRRALDAQVAALQAQYESEQEELRLLIEQEESAAEQVIRVRENMARSRKAEEPVPAPRRNNARKVPHGRLK